MAKQDVPKEADAPEIPEGPGEVQEELSPEDALAVELDELKDKLLRARADYDNLQKRHVREAELERERQKARVIEPFLQVFEFAQMAAMEAERTPGALAEGVKMLVREFERHIKEQGVTAFGERGDAFDPNLHEATGEGDGGVEPGQVSNVIRQGYKLGDRVLRYAKVTVQPEPTEPDA